MQVDGKDMLRGKTILFLVTEDWYFCSHRLPIARAARDAGLEVVVATRVTRHGPCIEREGFRLIPLTISRRSQNPLRELATFFEILRMYRRVRPDLVHHVAMKPVLYGSFAARVARVPVVINAIAGMGFVFSSDRWQARFLRPGISIAFRWLLNHGQGRTILQNPDDQRLLTGAGLVLPERTVLIRGSGVDISRFCPSPPPDDGPVVVTLISRMLRDKGIAEFVEAARLLKRRGVSVKAVVVGTPDPENPASILESQLLDWQAEGVIEWWGARDDIPGILAKSHIAVLPSYREGLPKTLLEAAACGRPIIATDVPGCREIVQHEENGLLIPVKDPAALAAAITHLAGDRDLRDRMGNAGRRLVESEFAESIVANETLELYRALLGPRWAK